MTSLTCFMSFITTVRKRQNVRDRMRLVLSPFLSLSWEMTRKKFTDLPPQPCSFRDLACQKGERGSKSLAEVTNLFILVLLFSSLTKLVLGQASLLSAKVIVGEGFLFF